MVSANLNACVNHTFAGCEFGGTLCICRLGPFLHVKGQSNANKPKKV